jgi:hypothetical protein
MGINNINIPKNEFILSLIVFHIAHGFSNYKNIEIKNNFANAQ